jgi:alkylation response protein AidB-like acyl-CoA dehydrogenase
MWITTGDRAGVSVVWARTSGAPGAKGISCFLVEPQTPGVSFGKPEEKMGLCASHTVSVSLQDVELPASAMTGEENQGFKLAMAALDGGRIGVAAQSTGIGTAALDRACAWARERKHGGTVIADHQGIQFKLADVATDLEAGWLLTLRAAWLKENHARFSREAAMAKVFASEAANRAVREAVQVCGGYGYLEENEVARLYRDCRVTQIYEGTSEVQRLVIGRDLLRSGVVA